MRPVTRRVTAAVLVAALLLLALGALPSYLRAGDPYYLSATPGAAPAGVEPIDAATLSERRYPYTLGALAATEGPGSSGRSDAYYRGPFGLKGAFTHSPFDEVAAHREQHPDAVADAAVYVRNETTTYRLTIDQEPDA